MNAKRFYRVQLVVRVFGLRVTRTTLEIRGKGQGCAGLRHSTRKKRTFFARYLLQLEKS